ncbi:hypothetical protein J5X84_09500 [Streptosporangiaceae bacterium NEAU-GS5]|nr:hypothetical protein [Streptosporangiaceae bacterium NEAU-GS5]
MTKKIGVSLPDDIYSWMRSRVEDGFADSISGLIADLAVAERQKTELTAFVADLVGEFGEPGPDADAWIDDAITRARGVRQGHVPAEEKR